MADVDKSLPNVRQNITVPSEQEQMEVQAEIQETVRNPKTENRRISDAESLLRCRAPPHRGARNDGVHRDPHRCRFASFHQQKVGHPHRGSQGDYLQRSRARVCDRLPKATRWSSVR